MFYMNIFLLLWCFAGHNDIRKIIDRGEIKQKGERTLDYTYILNSQNQPVLVTVTGENQHTIFRVYDGLDNIKSQIKITGNGFSRRRSFTYHDNLYCFMGRLFVIDFENYKSDTLQLKHDNYRFLNIVEFAGDTCLLASSYYNIHIYNWPDCQFLQEISRSEYRQFDNPICLDSLLIFQNKDNEITVYNSHKSEIIRTFNSGTESGYFLGVNLGIFNDRITSYRTTQERGDLVLYYLTSAGSLYKVNPVTGDTINYIHKFKGIKNNAGLISSFHLIDINSDGVKDLIGPSVDQNLYCINGVDFSVIWEFDTGYENQMPVSLYDLNQDQIPEVFNVNDAMKLTILDGKSGGKILQYQIKDQNYQTDVGIVKTDLQQVKTGVCYGVSY